MSLLLPLCPVAPSDPTAVPVIRMGPYVQLLVSKDTCPRCLHRHRESECAVGRLGSEVNEVFSD